MVNSGPPCTCTVQGVSARMSLAKRNVGEEMGTNGAGNPLKQLATTPGYFKKKWFQLFFLKQRVVCVLLNVKKKNMHFRICDFSRFLTYSF